VQNFRELKIWQRAHAVALGVYRATANFPDSERFGLISQMRRAASSMGANIAEGAGRGSNADFGRFLHNAMGSANELENFLLLSRDLCLLEASVFETLNGELQELKRMLVGFMARVKAPN
jgi:four helix bundle protein